MRTEVVSPQYNVELIANALYEAWTYVMAAHGDYRWLNPAFRATAPVITPDLEWRNGYAGRYPRVVGNALNEWRARIAHDAYGDAYPEWVTRRTPVHWEELHQAIAHYAEGLAGCISGHEPDRSVFLGLAIGKLATILRSFAQENRFMLYTHVTYNRAWMEDYQGFKGVPPTFRRPNHWRKRMA